MTLRPTLAPLASAGGTPVRSQYLPVALPGIGEREKQLGLETLDSGWITTGKHAHALGERVAAIAGARHGLALNSATGALHLALAALGVQRGDEVITSTYTFAACVNVIEHVGATPVVVDIEPDTLCLDPAALWASAQHRLSVGIGLGFARRLDLPPLSPPAVRAMLTSLFGDGALSERLAEGVVTGSEGNPLLLEEIVRSLGPRERYGVSIGWALFHATCGDLDSAAEWFARAIEERYSMVGALLHSAICGPLRNSRHWPPLARLMNLAV